jgi:hypothetical protein
MDNKTYLFKYANRYVGFIIIPAGNHLVDLSPHQAKT